jgi:hypothetical protein
MGRTPRLARRGEVQATNGKDYQGIAKGWKDTRTIVGSSYHNNTSWVLQLVNKTTIVFLYYNCNYKFMLMIA